VVTPAEFLRLAVEPRRLALLGLAASGSADAKVVAEAFGDDLKGVLKELAKLRAAGLIRVDGSLDAERLRELGAALPPPEGADPRILEGGWSPDEVAVLETFFEGTRLRQIPSQHAKRQIVLDRLAQEFEPGLRYSEQEISRTLQVFHDDYAALRRYMVDGGLLTRADGVYWRSGGRVEAANG
jgi:hypothetical protein